ncbi:60S ribosomal subunit assembly/export protein [Kalmusia sp. IMI 367209]|nr:60S ribosomal subunit assembly/export protein [Kalmusia sp. IMI 367209]
MAPTKSVKGKSSKGGKSGGSSKKSAKPKPTGSAPEGISKRKQKSLSLAKPGGAQKSKSMVHSNKRKKRVYTEKELDIPKLNGIIPAGIAKPKGQKKGKTFVDDPASMMAIMSVVNAEKDKDVESRIMRARQLEEVREAKRKEAEARAEEKASKFEETKKGLKKKRKSRHSDPARIEDVEDEAPKKSAKGKKKRVSFG